MTHRYVGRACPERKGQSCRVLIWGHGRPRNVLVEFADGHQFVTNWRCLRKGVTP